MDEGKKKLGLIVNPIAGMGGKVGLKGSDGPEIIARAKELGAKPGSPSRTVDALNRLFPIRKRIELITYPHDMGENEARESGLNTFVIGKIKDGETTERDTKKAASDMLRLGVDLVLFAGGDGTARDVYSVIGDKLPVLGIPSGVKIHSAVYGANPGKAGELAAKYLTGTSSEIRLKEAEVMDIDEQSFRENVVSAKLYGYLKIPFMQRMVQSPKAGGCAGGSEQLDDIATDVILNMEEGSLYIIGPGTTTRAIMGGLGLPNTLLGIDAVCDRQLVGSDLNEYDILKLLEGKEAKIIVSIIGQQGFIFGRGNQQISSRIIREVDKQNIIIIATMEKIGSLRGGPLLVDTGELEVDQILAGYMQVITGYRKRVAMKVEF